MLDADAAPIIGTFLLGKRRVLAVRYNGQKYVRLLGRAKQDLRHRHPRLWELIDKQPLDIEPTHCALIRTEWRLAGGTGGATASSKWGLWASAEIGEILNKCWHWAC